eukprot:1160167-Pelagomonas_calceolata.AAC.10
MSMRLQSKLSGSMSVKFTLFKGLQSVRGVSLPRRTQFSHHTSGLSFGSLRSNYSAAFRTILLGVGGVIYTPHTLEPLKELGLDIHEAIKLALKLYAHSVQYAYKFKVASTRHNLEKVSTNSHHQDQAQGTAQSTLLKERKARLPRQRKLSLHQLRKWRHVGSEEPPSNRVRQPPQLNANQRHVLLNEIKYRENTRPGQQLEAAQRQHADLCKNIRGGYLSMCPNMLLFVFKVRPLTATSSD